MNSVPRTLKLLADPTRLRLIALLCREEFSVAELREITQLGQSRISTHLGQMQESGLLRSRREGRRIFYRLNNQLPPPAAGLVETSVRGMEESPEAQSDLVNLQRILVLRNDRARLHFDQVAGRFDRSYGPGRSWLAFGQMLLQILPPMDIADLGAGEGLLSELFALRARRVIAVDNSPKMVEFGSRRARKNGLENLEFRLGDLKSPPIDPASVDLAVFSQALHHTPEPETALRSAHEILRPGGRIALLDLLQHEFVEARSLYGDHWLGFAESDLHCWLEAAGFGQIDLRKVAREADPPYFETLLAIGVKPG